MIRSTPRLLVLAMLATANVAPAAYAAGRPPRDTSVACGRADNQYCRTPDPARSGEHNAVPLHYRRSTETT